jgi:prepilin-type N-terminal cleavage/methylation domain-containing protein
MMSKRLRFINKNQAGFTLLELLIALVLATIVTGTTTMVIYQIFDGEARSSNHVEAITRVQNVGSRISTDAGMAQSWSTDDNTSTTELELLTLTWTEWEDSEVHTVVYSVDEDNQLKRVHSSNAGDEIRVFEYIYYTDPDDPGTIITFCEPDPGNPNQLNFTLTAIVGFGSQQERETRLYEVMPRPSIQ